MKKNFFRLLSLLLVVFMLTAAFAACELPFGTNPTDPTEPEHIDYVSLVKLDRDSTDTKKYEVTWGDRSHVDGDTSHFNVPKDFDASGLVKIRYLAVDTPETTGQIEEWGKAASRFTKEKLSTAVSIIIESDGANWGFDGNGRYLCWVWYKPSADAEYRNLNIELLQNGLGFGSKSLDTRYGQYAVDAISQASREKLHVFSKEKDPEFPYGGATAVSLRELRTNVDSYVDVRVSVEGVVTFNSDYTAYIESYDAETDMYYGMQVFYGYNASLINVLEQGSLVRVVGVVSNYYGTYQIMDLKYNPMRPDDPSNTWQLESGHEPAYTEVTAEEYAGSKTIELEDGNKTVSFQQLAVSTSISMKNLVVGDIWTTVNPSASDVGAMTLTCKVGNVTVSVRTAVLKDAEGNLITDAAYAGKTIDVKGIIEHYNGSYQIKVMSAADITVH